MTEARTYSSRLGAISDAQFEAVAARLGLGRFLKAEPTTSGLFGQNVFVTTSEGEFVLRGAPHWVKGPSDKDYRQEDRWQFSKERYFAERLHELGVPTPWPMLHDEASDIFGWPYLVMPRMPGRCFEDRGILDALPAEDRLGVAEAMGAMLARMQTLTSPFAGDFDIDTIVLRPEPGGAVRWTAAEARRHGADAAANGAMTEGDWAWIDRAEALALSAGERPNTYVHGDYKLNNLSVSRDGPSWRVTGLFDLHEARFADGVIDIVRQAASYLDTDRERARPFVRSYLDRIAPVSGLADILPLYVINDRMKFWAYFTRPEPADWTKGKTFRGWAERYLNAILALL